MKLLKKMESKFYNITIPRVIKQRWLVILVFGLTVQHVFSIAQEKIFVTENGQKMKVSYLNMDLYEDKMLMVAPFSAFLEPTTQNCRQHCLKSPPCISMNVKNHNATFVACYLLDKDVYTDFGKYKDHLIDAFGVDHYYIVVSFYLLF